MAVIVVCFGFLTIKLALIILNALLSNPQFRFCFHPPSCAALYSSTPPYSSHTSIMARPVVYVFILFLKENGGVLDADLCGPESFKAATLMFSDNA